jgi:hypothetical protein
MSTKAHNTMKKIVQSVLPILIFGLTTSLTFAQKVYFGNLHSHTSYSDGTGTPEDAYRYARDEAKIDFLAITEHNHHAAPSRLENEPELYNGTIGTSLISAAKRFNQDGRFIAIYGQEFSSIGTGNHANVFEVGDVIQPSEVPNGRWDKLLDIWLLAHMDSQGKPAIMLLNHPSISGSSNDKEYGIDDYPTLDAWRTAIERHVSLINMINGPSHKDTGIPGRPAESEFLRYLNMGLHVAPTADQDNHLANWGNAANTRTGVVASSLTKTEILQALRQRNVYATEDPNLEVIVRVNDKLMGTIFDRTNTPSVGSDLNFQVTINDRDEEFALYTIDVYSDVIGGPLGEATHQFTFENNGSFTLDGIKYAGGNQYFFLKITQTNPDGEEEDRVWTAPVWFEPNREPTSETGVFPNATSLALDVNVVTEEAKITNRGSSTVNLKNWVLVSVKGNQRYTIGNISLAPGKSITIVSGANARAGTDTVVWTTSYIWSNDGDPAQLYNANGQLVVETE